MAMDGSENVQQEIMNHHLMQLELRLGSEKRSWEDRITFSLGRDFVGLASVFRLCFVCSGSYFKQG